jgi:SAM-dependent methyltransferase
MTSPRFEPGSFRDRDSRVLLTEDAVRRALSPRGVDAWRLLAATGFWQQAQKDEKVIATREASGPALEGWALELEHDRIGWVSYPYEWSFGMLRDAALLHLELLETALAENFTLKDATPYNLLFEGCRPVFIDVGSFEPWKHEPWAAYLQFCQLFLYPLLINAYADVPFQPLLRGALEGLTPAQTSAWLPRWRDRIRPGVFRDVFLQAKLQAGTQGQDRGVRQELRQAGFGKELILHNVRRLRGIVEGLSWGRRDSEWSGYAEDNSYDAGGKAFKEGFVESALRRRPRREVLDLGANTGHYSRLAAAHAERVVAVDGDPLAVERLYRRLRAEGPANILPLVMDLANPSPGLGWRHAERASFASRARPDLTLALALLHHLSLSAHVPIPELVEWLAGFGGEVVVEFVGKTDPMAQRLLRNKVDIYDDYDQDVFEREVARHFEVVERAAVPSAPRTLYLLAPRASADARR